ncbi:sigma-70 family RNA polymerase sigma factor [Asticcacaulis sp. BYS171W]|uniref:Sigma-70 family RNA polymerase sigma factor n=1 Tax=Asticcacaulis aquaticus TaxID=2984212 RepID=A0ABT5HYK5_9CAUL|nr:sigma-70 family RNA polymerase sigma factor [Asticcacaulis aquaticus]MDC7685113.1 sigma-70 family RNA polymerase sigma factor [Asticcacaulis aquaticus]
MTAPAEHLAFIGTHILPHEAGLRHWLARAGLTPSERDDLVQEVYYRLLRQTGFDHIEDPRAYMYRTARNIMLEQIRKNRVVSITTVQNIDELGSADLTPSPERAVSARRELSRVMGFIEALPARCRAVFELRKVHGLSQAETAQRLSVSENIVEKETAKGLSLILKRIAEGDGQPRSLPVAEKVQHVRH